MFTQEQLGAIKSVVVEAVKPLVGGLEKRMDEKFDGLEKRLIDRMDDGFDKMDEKLDFLDQKMDKGFEHVKGDITHIKGDIAILLDTTTNMEEKLNEVGGTMLDLKDDMRRLKANTSIWVVRDEGDDSYTQPK